MKVVTTHAKAYRVARLTARWVAVAGLAIVLVYFVVNRIVESIIGEDWSLIGAGGTAALAVVLFGFALAAVGCLALAVLLLGWYSPDIRTSWDVAVGVGCLFWGLCVFSAFLGGLLPADDYEWTARVMTATTLMALLLVGGLAAGIGASLQRRRWLRELAVAPVQVSGDADHPAATSQAGRD